MRSLQCLLREQTFPGRFSLSTCRFRCTSNFLNLAMRVICTGMWSSYAVMAHARRATQDLQTRKCWEYALIRMKSYEAHVMSRLPCMQ